MKQHAMFDSPYPPSAATYEPETLTSDICLHLCHGTKPSTILSIFEDEFLPEEWKAVRGDEPRPESLQATIDAVVAEYKERISSPSPHAKALAQLHEKLAEKSITTSIDDGYDKAEAAEIAYDAAIANSHSGYVYCTVQDIDTVIATGDLYFGFASISGNEEDSLAVARELCATLSALGLNPKWSGKASARVLCAGILLEIPVAS